MVFPDRLGAFRFWCQKVLPLVYDDSLSYYELLCKVVKYLNETMGAVDSLTEVVENFLSSGVIDEEISNKLDEMVEDGTLAEIIDQEIFGQIEQRLDAIFDKTIVVYGDSYCESSNSFVEQCMTLMDVDSNHYKKFALSGYGFSGGVGKWRDLVLSTANTMTADFKSQVTDVIFIGGRNDADRLFNGSETIATLNTYRNEAINNAKTTFPNASIHCAFIASREDPSKVNAYSNCLERVYKSIDSISKCDYYDGIECVMLKRDNRQSDNNHISSTGHTELAKYLGECIRTGRCNVYYGVYTVAASNSVFSDASQPSANESLYDGQIKVVLGIGNKHFTENQTLVCDGTASHRFKLFDLSGDGNVCVLSNDASRCVAVPMTCILHDSEGYHNVAGILYFMGVGVYISLKDVDATGYKTYTDVDVIQFPSYNTFVVPAW